MCFYQRRSTYRGLWPQLVPAHLWACIWHHFIRPSVVLSVISFSFNMFPTATSTIYSTAQNARLPRRLGQARDMKRGGRCKIRPSNATLSGRSRDYGAQGIRASSSFRSSCRSIFVRPFVCCALVKRVRSAQKSVMSVISAASGQPLLLNRILIKLVSNAVCAFFLFSSHLYLLKCMSVCRLYGHLSARPSVFVTQDTSWPIK